AMMPSSVAPTCLSHFLASASLVVIGDSRMDSLPRRYFRVNRSSNVRLSLSGILVRSAPSASARRSKKQRRRFGSEAFHATSRRVNTLQQVVEGKCPAARNDNFTVEHELSGLDRANGLNELWEIACQRLSGF